MAFALRAERKKTKMLEEEVKQLREQYTELREALVGDSPNWTHEELIEFTIKGLKTVMEAIE